MVSGVEAADPKSLPEMVAREAGPNPINWRFAEQVGIYGGRRDIHRGPGADLGAKSESIHDAAAIFYALEPVIAAVFAYLYLE